MLNKFYFGLLAEYIIAIYYISKGFRPLKHRWRCLVGEIDLILIRGRTLVFCEVKARRSNFNREFFVTHRQQYRNYRAAEAFIAKHQVYHGYAIVFTIAVVQPWKWPQVFRLEP